MNRRELISTISLGGCYLLFRQSIFFCQAQEMLIVAIGHRTSSYLNEFTTKRSEKISFIGEEYQVNDDCLNMNGDVIICKDEDLIDSTLIYCQRQRKRYGLVMEITRSNKEFIHELIEKVEKYCPDSLFFINIPPITKLCVDDCKMLSNKNNVLLINSNEYLKNLDGTMLFKEAFELLDEWISDKMDEWFV